MIIGIIATFLHSQSLSLCFYIFMSWYCYTFCRSFSFAWLSGHAAWIMWHSFDSLSTTLMSRMLCFSLWSVCTWKSYSILACNFSSPLSSVCSYHLFLVGNPYHFHITQWTSAPNLSCRHRWYCFCANILHSTTTLLIVSCLSPHNLHRGKTLNLWTYLFAMLGHVQLCVFFFSTASFLASHEFLCSSVPLFSSQTVIVITFP